MGDSIISILFMVLCFSLIYSFVARMIQVKKDQQKQRNEYEENRIKYRNFTSTVCDETPDDKLAQAVMFHITAKEDKLYEADEIEGDLKDKLTYGELVVYTIYQVEAAMAGNQGSIHTFFINEPFCTYRPYVKAAFEAIGCQEIVTLMVAADKLAVMIENDEEIEVNYDSDYGKYNFADFTDELKAKFKSSEIGLKVAKFIRENKLDFIDVEVENND